MEKFPIPKYLFILLLVGGITLIGFYLISWQEKKKFEKNISENEALLIIKGKKERWFNGRVIPGMTFLNVLEASAKAGNFEFKANSELKVIDDFSNNSRKKWKCYLNGDLIQDSNQIISPRDKIVCEYR